MRLVMRYMRFLAVAVLAVVLALSSAQNAFAAVGLAYDNGNTKDTVGTAYAGVRFSLPAGVVSARLVYVRFADSSTGDLWIHVTAANHITELSGSPIHVGDPGQPPGTGCPAGWTQCYGLVLTSYGIVVSGDFFVVLEKNQLSPYYDNANPGSGRSFYGDSLAGLTNPILDPDHNNFLIRVDIDPIAPSGPVGGFMMPVNKLVVFAPYLALFGIVATVAVIAWKRPDN